MARMLLTMLQPSRLGFSPEIPKPGLSPLHPITQEGSENNTRHVGGEEAKQRSITWFQSKRAEMPGTFPTVVRVIHRFDPGA